MVTLKRILIVVCCSIICLSLPSCAIRILSNSRGAMTDSEMRRVAQQVLEEKYGERFDVTKTENDREYKSCFFAYANPSAHPEMLFSAHISDDGRTIDDDYFTRTMGSRVSESVRKSVGDIGGEYYIFTSCLSMDGMGESDITMDPSEYAAKHNAEKFTISFYYAPYGGVDTSLLYSRLTDAIADIPAMNGCLVFHVVDNDMLHNVREYIQTNHCFSKDAVMDILKGETQVKMYYGGGRTDLEYEEFSAALKDVNILTK